ncbi:sulfotransferase domain-containing protein [Pelagibacterales bacterium SAG-MED46]|nr:sulfotransferase domain-containing protein [Pelagibacterales bacterium SAG-MED46]
MIYLLHIYRCLKKFFKFPSQFMSSLQTDIKKDFLSKKLKPGLNVLVIGLPKSGTTMIEEILSEIGFVNQANSILRLFDDRNLPHHHDLSRKMLNKIPKNKNTFLKRHSEPTITNLQIIEQYNFKTFVSIRNLIDVMISRYLHLSSDEKQPQFKIYSKYDLLEGFRISLIKNHREKDVPIQIFEDWIEKWQQILLKKKNFCLLDYDSYKKNNYMYFQKIFNFLEIDQSQIETILSKHLKNQRLLNQKSFQSNLKQNFYSQTYNNKSEKIRNIIKNDLETIKFFNSKVIYSHNKIEII